MARKFKKRKMSINHTKELLKEMALKELILPDLSRKQEALDEQPACNSLEYLVFNYAGYIVNIWGVNFHIVGVMPQKNINEFYSARGKYTDYSDINYWGQSNYPKKNEESARMFSVHMI